MFPRGRCGGFATFLAPAAFLLGFLDATLLSVVPLYMATSLHVHNLALIGLVGFLELGLGGVTPLFARNVPPRTAVMWGAGGGALASLLVVTASTANSVGLVLAAAAIIGLLNGLTLQGATAICGVSAPLRERGKLISALYMCAYAGTIPTIALGYLAQDIGLTKAVGVFSAGAMILAAFVILVGGACLPPGRALPGARGDSAGPHHPRRVRRLIDRAGLGGSPLRLLPSPDGS